MAIDRLGSLLGRYSGLLFGPVQSSDVILPPSWEWVFRMPWDARPKQDTDGWNPVQEKDSKNKVTANMLAGLDLDRLFSRSPASGSPSYLLTDALGSTVALADTSGVISTSYTYEPFGKTTVAGASSTNPFAFTGRENDSTGSLSLYNYRARYYSPVLQRFLTEDPMGFAAGDVNLYAYVGDSPTNWRDPLGRERDGGCGLFGLRCAYRFVVQQPGRVLSDVAGCVAGGAEAFVALVPLEAAAPPTVVGVVAVGCAGGVWVSEATRGA